jgi:uncharacterized protein
LDDPEAAPGKLKADKSLEQRKTAGLGRQFFFGPGATIAAMKFQLDRLEGLNRFTGHGPGYVEVNGERINSNVVVGGDWADRGALADGVVSLAPELVAALLERHPEVVLLGTGAAFRFPSRALLAPIQAAGIGVEVMDTPAACRTFNILLGEGRNVIAALVVE